MAGEHQHVRKTNVQEEIYLKKKKKHIRAQLVINSSMERRDDPPGPDETLDGATKSGVSCSVACSSVWRPLFAGVAFALGAGGRFAAVQSSEQESMLLRRTRLVHQVRVSYLLLGKERTGALTAGRSQRGGSCVAVARHLQLRDYRAVFRRHVANQLNSGGTGCVRDLIGLVISLRRCSNGALIEIPAAGRRGVC